MWKICSLTDFNYSPRSSERCGKSLNKKLRPEFYRNCSIFFPLFLQLKIQIFFPVPSLKAFLFHFSPQMTGICAWHRADAEQHSHAEQYSLGLQWKRRSEKCPFILWNPTEWRDIAGSWWDLWEQGLCKPVRQSPQCECVAPHMCLCTLSRRRMYRPRITPRDWHHWHTVFWWHSSFSHRSHLSSLPQMFTQDRHKCFLSKETKREVGELNTPPPPRFVPGLGVRVNSLMLWWHYTGVTASQEVLVNPAIMPVL